MWIAYKCTWFLVMDIFAFKRDLVMFSVISCFDFSFWQAKTKMVTVIVLARDREREAFPFHILSRLKISRTTKKEKAQ